MTRQPLHPARSHIHQPLHLGDRAADFITAFVGSWFFVIIHVVWFTFWIVMHIESYPYGLLTLVVSLEAIFLSTFVLISQNRASDRDRVRDNLEAQEVGEIHFSHKLLMDLNQQQISILNQQTSILNQQTEILHVLREADIDVRQPTRRSPAKKKETPTP